MDEQERLRQIRRLEIEYKDMPWAMRILRAARAEAEGGLKKGLTPQGGG